MAFLRENKKKIIVGVLAISIVTIILGLGLGLGLDLQKCQNKVVPHTSCRNRCFEPFDDKTPGCRCDENCLASNSCCFDFHDICTVATQQWECTKLRCGEKRLTESKCHCSDDCVSAADCCTNYKHICHGEKEWVEGECENLSPPSCPAGFKRPPLLLVSLDGLRAEYLHTWHTLLPVLDKLRKCGTSAPYMQSAFPSKTFPNHYTIVTGLYPEANGLIDNEMYDPVFDATFSLSNSEKDNPRWYLGQPIWHTARYQGLKSGTYFWPGSDVKINGSFPDLCVPYNGKVPFEERVFTLLKWLQLPDDQRPDFYTLYLEEPDKSGHKFGPLSGGLIAAIQGVDRIIRHLMNGLKQIGLHRCINIIVVADHVNSAELVANMAIWHTARYQGLKSGTYFWPGSDVKINGSFPDLCVPYNGKVPFEERVFTLLKWLQLPDDQRPDFYTLYLEEPDKSGHKFGPLSGGLIAAIQGVDRIIRHLMNGLKQIGLHRCINIIVVADHGMEEISCSRTEALQELVGDISPYWVIEGPFGRIRAKNQNTVLNSAELVANMACQKPDQNIKPYLKANLPKRLHFANSRRIEDVSVLVNPKWLFERYPGSLRFCSGGNHGYDNDVESMNAMFLSYGPQFHSKTEIEPFSNIELYNLMCDVLQISPMENNGTHGSLNHILRQPTYSPVPPTEQSRPEQCPLLSLEPEDSLGCFCPALSGNTINSRLNLTAQEVDDAKKKHLLFGRPQMLQKGSSYCVLYQHGFISAYSHSALMPLWSSFTVNKPEDLDPLPPVTPDCLRADVRLRPSHSPTCHEYNRTGNLTYAFLYPPNLNKTADEQFDALLMSNVVPMYPAFKKIWNYFQSTLLKKYASDYNGINVVTGPVFDYNYDGKYDTPEQIQQFISNTSIPIPTHYFAILTSCRNSSQAVNTCNGELQTVSFMLPHRPDNSESCKSAEAESHWVEELMWFHQARVKDVEWLTGLDLYQENTEGSQLLQLKTRPTVSIHRKLTV
ncbi:ectonucleotide pyrophosphatase/phosphodiesterase family member 3 [Thalassophryne amazonica]|uniref:ectonucleotide pyrophosphatase/phosphodiesterase family member 3 n=1 Tax=Thalassophryne amazonica TaxID=390379 RepID=UPI00147159C1|nr:ectonucleotide pyrophosphatase/phosphodiesterase family member 3 [Thalassophryne amazonica]